MGKRVQNFNLKNLETKVINLGYVGENVHTQIVIECSEVLWDYPNAVASMVVQPPRGDLYPVEVTREENNIIWEITASDVVYAGSGRVQLTFTNDGEIVKSAVGTTRISGSIEATGEAPEPLQNWIDQAEETAYQIALTAKDEVIEQIQDAAEEARESIPADYTQLSDDVTSLKSALNAHFQGLDIITSIISGTFSGSNLTISNAAGGSIVCFPVVSGKKYTIVKPNTTGYWRIGYSEAVPAIGTTLTNYNIGASVSSLYATFTAPISGYIAALVSNDTSNKAVFDSGVYAYEGEYNESYDIYTATLINTNVPVNINERLSQIDTDILALEAKDSYIENKVDFAYTDNDVINSNISDCKVQIISNSVKKVVLDFPNNATTYLYVTTYDANDTQIDKKACGYSIYYDTDTKLLLVKTSDYLIRMIIDLDFVSENHPAYTGAFGSPAFGNSKLFDEQNYPYDRHITDFAPTSSGNPLSNYMKVRDGIKEIYLNSETVTTLSITNGKNLVLKNGSTTIFTKEFGENYIGTILVNDYCGIYIDTTNIYGISLGNIPISKTTSADNPVMSSRHVFYCGENREIKTLKAGIEAAEQYMNSVLYVDAGVYDLIEEFGDDYFANLTGENQQAGLKLYNGIHIIFSSNSIVTAHYTGNNENVCTCFSPFNNGPYGFTMENLTLYSSRTRYGVHDVGGTTHNTTKYINCHIEQDNSNNQYWPQSCAIGAGLGTNQETEVSNCVFKGQVYWHLSSGESSDFRGRVQCVDSYFIDNTLQVSASRSDAPNDTEFVFTGNSLATVSGAGTDGIIRNFVSDACAVIYAWGNEVRS